MAYSSLERWHGGQGHKAGPSAFPSCPLTLYVLLKCQHNVVRKEFGSATSPSAVDEDSGLQEGTLLGTTALQSRAYIWV